MIVNYCLLSPINPQHDVKLSVSRVEVVQNDP
jgi:hypothetical protein